MEQFADLGVYSERVLGLFDNPPHAGAPAGSNLIGEAHSRSRHARVRLRLRLNAGKVEVAGFEALGCPHLIAGSELVAQDLQGRIAADLVAYHAGFLDDALPLPAEKRDLRILLEDAVRDAGHRAAGGD